MSNRKKIRRLAATVRRLDTALSGELNDRILAINSRLDTFGQNASDWETTRGNDGPRLRLLEIAVRKLERIKRVGRDPKIGYIVHDSCWNPAFLIRHESGYAFKLGSSVFNSAGERTGADLSQALRMNYVAAQARVAQFESMYSGLKIVWAPRDAPPNDRGCVAPR